MFVGGTTAVMGLGGLGEEEGDPDNSSLPATRSHILTAQFECYMKINEDPPRQGNGESPQTGPASQTGPVPRRR